MKDQIETVKAVCLAVGAILLVILLAWIADAPDRELLEKVKNGELTLQCHFKDGWRVVEPDKVTDFYGNTWIFTNGSASRCKLK